MEKKHENRRRMYGAVLQVLQGHSAVWQTNAGFKEVADEFENNLDAIDEARGQAGISTNGITEDKSLMQENLIDSIMEISGPFATMANRMSNNELKNKITFTDSSLDSLTESALAKTGIELAKLALQNVEGLAKYGVTAEEINALEKLSGTYNNKISGPRETVAERMAARENLIRLIRDTTSLLKNDLDGMVDKYRRSNPDFWNAYFNARRIVDYGIRHEKETESKSSKE